MVTARLTAGPWECPPQDGPRGGRAAGTQLTGGEVPVVVDDRVEEVRPPGVFRVPHGPFIEEDVLVGSREISAVLHVDDKEPMPGFPSCDCLQLGHHLHGELLQVLVGRGVPGGVAKWEGGPFSAAAGASPAQKRQSHSTQAVVSPARPREYCSQLRPDSRVGWMQRTDDLELVSGEGSRLSEE